MKDCQIIYGGVILWEKGYILTNYWEKMRGLLGRDEIREEEAYVFLGTNSLHTFFMKFPIDVIFLNKSNEIVKLAHNLSPQRLSCCFRAVSFIEVKAGTTNKYGLREKQRLTIKII